jgi:hypothetical protein
MVRKVLATLAMSAAAATAASAQINFVGTSTGCFGAACVPGGSATLQGLVFTGGQFNTTTDANGLAPVGGLNNNFGTLSLSSTPNFNYNGQVFTLALSFVQPGTATTSFNATLSGVVQQTNQGVLLVFNPSSNNNVLFSNGLTANVSISNPIGVNAENPAQQISGAIQSTVPEPATVVLMGSGLAALGFFGARRKKA